MSNKCAPNALYTSPIYFSCIYAYSRQGTDRTSLTGWDFVQEKMLSHDEDMIAYFADDIDTLLVFVRVDKLSDFIPDKKSIE